MDSKVTGKELMEALIVITPWIADILQVDRERAMMQVLKLRRH